MTVTVPANCYVVIGSADVAAVDGIEMDGAASSSLRAYALGGRIVVDYAPGAVMVYAADGNLCGTLRSGDELPAAPGIYILKSGAETLKMLVK